MNPPVGPRPPVFGQSYGSFNVPAKLKVYAPDGTTMEHVALLCIREQPNYDQLTELFLQHEDGTIEVLNKKVVVMNLETGVVCYNPRTCPRHFGQKVFITGSEKHWLDKNPHWPAVLELWDNPVEQGSSEGLRPDDGNESDFFIEEDEG